MNKRTKTEIYSWVAGQFYHDVKNKEPSQDYENWENIDIETEITRQVESLCDFLGVEDE